VNKDFFTKPLSLKDIKIPQISIKGLKNNKLFFICIFIIVFFIVSCIIGANLLNERDVAKQEKLSAENKYNSLMAAPSKEVMKDEIAVMSEQIEQYGKKIAPIDPSEFTKLLENFKSSAPIKWSKDDAKVDLITDEKGFENYDIYKVSINLFKGTLKDVQEFLAYVEGYERIVRVESLQIRKNQTTGSLDGQTLLLFYFSKLKE